MNVDISKITTETRNNNTVNIDTVSTIEMVEMINNEDKKVAIAVEQCKNEIAMAIELGFEAIQNGGRVIYFGAGTSGRLGILDASEILPTFGEENLFVGLIAGGEKAIRTPVENAEDNKEFVIKDLEKINASKKDLFVGIAASGRTPYVISGLEFAKKIQAKSVSISTSKNADISNIADVSIEAVVGAETVTGSTRMKSGTAQKLILNTISTGIMVKMNKTYSNFMVDIKATNLKLIERATKMVQKLTDLDYDDAKKLFLEDSGKNVKVAVVMHHKQATKENAEKILANNNGSLRSALI